MKIRLSIVFLFSVGLLLSQVPQKINYQGVARNSAGTALANIPLTLTITINNTSGSYSESHTVISNSIGVFTLHIGNGTPLSGSFGSIDWTVNPTNLSGIIDDGTGAYNFGPQQLVSVPYALYAEKAGSAPSPAVSFSSGVLTVGSNSVLIPASSYTGGSGISVGSGTITNTAPDQLVTIAAGSNVTVSGSYPNFTVASIASTPSITGAGITTVNQSGNTFTVSTLSPTLIGTGSTTVSGVYPTFIISSAIISSTTAAGVTSVVAGNGLTGTPGNTISTTGTLSLANSGVAAGAYGSAPSTAAIFTVDATGRITNAANLSLSTPTAISGDAQGPLASTTVTALQGKSVLATPPTSGQVLQFNGVNWAPFTPTAAAGPWYKPSASVVGLTTITDNVGIGTTSPLARLDLTDNANFNTFNLYNGNTSNYTGAQLNSLSSLYTTHTANDGSGVALDVVKSPSASSGRAAQFAISNASNASDAAVFSTNGNGNGIFTSASGTGYALKASNSASGRAGLFQGGLDVSGKTSGTGNFALNVTNSSATNLMNIRDDGYVGINNTSPTAQLDIISGSFNLMRIATTGTNSNTNIDAYPTGAGQLYFRVPTSNGIGFATSNATRMTIDPSGRVGIGTSAPTKTLEVAGNVRINDGTQGLNKVLTSDAAGNASWQPPSVTPQVGFHAGTNPVANQVLPASTTTIIQFGAGINFFNDGGGYNTGTYKFTPPSVGVYEIATHVSIQGTSGAVLQVWISTPAGWVVRSVGSIPSTGTTIVSLSATVNSSITGGPYWVEVFSNSPVTVMPYDSHFSGHRVY